MYKPPPPPIDFIRIRHIRRCCHFPVLCSEVYQTSSRFILFWLCLCVISEARELRGECRTQLMIRQTHYVFCIYKPYSAAFRGPQVGPQLGYGLSSCDTQLLKMCLCSIKQNHGYNVKCIASCWFDGHN
jgi:hypothetical protein